MRIRHLPLPAGAALLALLVAGCGSGASSSNSAAAGGSTAPATTQAGVNPNGPEVSPSGDIPDNQAYVPFRAPAGYVVSVPEGWSQGTAGSAVVFTDRLNAIRLETTTASAAPTVASVQGTTVAQLRRSVPGFRLTRFSATPRPAGTAIRVAYLADGTPNAVTGKSTPQAVERYLFFHRGRELAMTLSAPRGADNVDPWRKVTSSLRWTR